MRLFLTLFLASLLTLGALLPIWAADDTSQNFGIKMSWDDGKKDFVFTATFPDPTGGHATEATPEEIPLLIDQLGSTDEKVKMFALARLVETGEAAITPLGEALQTKDDEQRAIIIFTLVKIGKKTSCSSLRLAPIEEALIRETSNVNGKSCIFSAMLLTLIGGDKALNAVRPLLMEESEPDGMRQAILICATMKNRKELLPEIKTCLQTKDSNTRAFAACALYRMEGEKACDELLPLLSTNDPVVYWSASICLDAMRNTNADEIIIKRMLTDEDAQIRVLSAMTLASSQKKSNIKYFIQASHDNDPKVRATAATALGKFRKDKDALTTLHALQNDPDKYVEEAANSVILNKSYNFKVDFPFSTNEIGNKQK